DREVALGGVDPRGDAGRSGRDPGTPRPRRAAGQSDPLGLPARYLDGGSAVPGGLRSTTFAITGAPGARSSRPPTTTCSPAFTPLVTSTNPGVRTPSSTWRRLTLPSTTTQTAFAPSAGTTASSGMTMALGRTPVTRCASMNIPGCSSRAGLGTGVRRSEEHTSELQSPDHLVCRLLLEKKKQHKRHNTITYKNKS